MEGLRDSVRRLLRQPGFTTIAVVGLALGIGASVATFALVYGALLRPLSFPQPDRLVTLSLSIPQFAAKYPFFPVNADSYFDWRQHSRTLAGLALANTDSWVMTGTRAGPMQVNGVQMSAGMFAMLGVAPALGRDFTAADDEPHRNGVVILTDAFWRSQFQGDRNVIGKVIDLDGTANQIVGVMPASLHFPDPAQLAGVFFASGATHPIQLFRPLGLNPVFNPENAVGNYNYLCVARMRAGVTPRQVKAELDVLNAGIVARAKLPPDVGQVRVNTVVQSLQTQLVGAHATGLWMLLAAAGAMLGIVCVNLAGLQLIQVQGRSQELAVRTALGATPGRLMSDVLREGVLVALAGGALGVLAAAAGLRWLVHLAPAGIPRLDEVRINVAELAFSAGLALACGAVFSLWPAWQAAHVAPQSALRAGGRGTSDSSRSLRRRGWLVAVETALAAWLLIVAGLLTASYWRLLHVDTGFEAQNAIVAQLQWPGNHADRMLFLRQVLDKARQLPGVTAAGLIGTPPMQGGDDTDLLSRENDSRPMIERPLAIYSGVSAGYFSAMGIPLLRGRDFTAAEILAPDAPKIKGAAMPPVAAVISQSAAQALWPDRDPIGQQFGRSDPGEPPFTVVGVVANVRQYGLDRPPELAVYLPYTYTLPGDGALVLRSAQRPALLADSIRQAVWSVRPDAAIPTIASMQALVDTSLQSRRFQLTLVLLFAVAALLLAALGIYGVVAYSVERRRPEISLRMVLGARNGDLLGLVYRQGLTPVAAGLLAALAAALASRKLVASLLYGVPAADPLVLSVVVAALLLTALLACSLPARRALGVNPVEVLKGS